jgi:hypothetical protein
VVLYIAVKSIPQADLKERDVTVRCSSLLNLGVHQRELKRQYYCSDTIARYIYLFVSHSVIVQVATSKPQSSFHAARTRSICDLSQELATNIEIVFLYRTVSPFAESAMVIFSAKMELAKLAEVKYDVLEIFVWNTEALQIQESQFSETALQTLRIPRSVFL